MPAQYTNASALQSAIRVFCPPQAFEHLDRVTTLTKFSFDTIKVRLQTSEKAQFRGPLDCFLQTVKNEGARGLYKGSTPPLVGWMFMDSMYACRMLLIF